MRLRSIGTAGLALLAAASVVSAAGAAQKPAKAAEAAVISTGKEVALAAHLAPEKPTVFVFIRPASSLERAFLEELRQEAGEAVGFAVVHLRTGKEPVARQHDVQETPAALVYDRRGRLTGRSSDAAEVRAVVRKAAGVMRIDWAEEGDPRFEEVSRLLGRRAAPGILRTMSLQPEYLAAINDLARKAHFSDGYLDRRTKEMIATYVSALNKCKY
jgi:hypothetical protein